MYLFVLGRQSEISLAEIRAVFGNAELVLPDVVLVKSASPPDIDRLGGTRKIARIIYDNDGKPAEFLIKKFSELPQGKITLGVSHYGKAASADSAKKTGMMIKKQLNRSVRILPNSAAEISDAASLGNKLGTGTNKLELLMAYVGHRLIIAELIGVQDLNSYTLRDRGRPKRDARVGMLPPKLAQIMINLASPKPGDLDKGYLGGSTEGSHPKNVFDEVKKFSGEEVETGPKYPSNEPGFGLTLLDPFCGTGVVLQEAALMGFNTYGTDIDPRMISYSKTNLDWLSRTFELSNFRTFELKVGDATDFKWQQPIDTVVSEVYLGAPYSVEPPPEKLRENMKTCNLIIEKFLRNIAPQLKPGTPLCLAIPVWFVGGKTYYLPVADKTEELGFKQLTMRLPDQLTDRLTYHRENQIVGRNLLVLFRDKSL